MRLVAAIIGLMAMFGGNLLSGVALAQDLPSAVPSPVPLPRARPPAPPVWAQPLSFREAAGQDFDSAAVTSEPSACRKRLDLIAATSPMPRLIGPGTCGGTDMVEIDAVLMPNKERIALRPAPVLRCELAEQLSTWVIGEAHPRITKAGMALKSVTIADDYDCRGRNRVRGAKMSEHGMGNAVDLYGFVLADKRVIKLTDKTVPKELRAGLRESACARFTTVLGPGSDGYHEEHIHFDLAARR
ncbi:MAG: extensin family protein, partial [Pseudolabrys sp.]